MTSVSNPNVQEGERSSSADLSFSSPHQGRHTAKNHPGPKSSVEISHRIRRPKSTACSRPFGTIRRVQVPGPSQKDLVSSAPCSLCQVHSPPRVLSAQQSVDVSRNRCFLELVQRRSGASEANDVYVHNRQTGPSPIRFAAKVSPSNRSRPNGRV